MSETTVGAQGLKFTRSARKHRVGRAHALHVIHNTTHTRYPPTGDLETRSEWIGPDDRGPELETIAVELSDLFLVRHAHRPEEEAMSDEIRVLDGEIDVERDDVRDSHGRRFGSDYRTTGCCSRGKLLQTPPAKAPSDPSRPCWCRGPFDRDGLAASSFDPVQTGVRRP